MALVLARDGDVSIHDVEHRVAGNEGGRVSVRTESEMDEVERFREDRGIVGRRRIEVVGLDGHGSDVGAASGREAGAEVGQVSIRVAVGSDALVDLVDRHLLPRHLPGEVREHRPGRASTADGEREPSAVSDGRAGTARQRTRRRALQQRPHRAGSRSRAALDDYAFFSSWPPNSFRIADRSLSAKSSSPREAKRE